MGYGLQPHGQILLPSTIACAAEIRDTKCEYPVKNVGITLYFSTVHICPHKISTRYPQLYLPTFFRYRSSRSWPKSIVYWNELARFE